LRFSVSGTLPQAFRLLGGSSFTHLDLEDLAANAGEELADTARLLSHVVDCLVVRTHTAS
jgi:ornithine carbamoyltransferase